MIKDLSTTPKPHFWELLRSLDPTGFFKNLASPLFFMTI